jgi:branched-chain amino acid aminotransferase
MPAAEIEAIIREGIRRLGTDRALSRRPMMWSREGSPAIIAADPGSTAVAICLEDLPMRTPGPMALTVSPFRRPSPDSAICSAKAACHYPNNARIVREARARGFHNALSLDQEGHVAETASSNAFLVQGGVVMTPVANGTFLAGITRARIIALLRADGVEVIEASLDLADFTAADEIFLTGNASKVVPVTRFEHRELGAGPIAARAWTLYRDFAHQARQAA